MKARTEIIIVIVVFLFLSAFSFFRDRATEQAKESPASSFAWRYEDGGLNPDGLPNTRIGMDVTYEDGFLLSIPVDEVAGSCNAVDISDADTDIVPGTTKIQCYAAGFGQWYRLVRGNSSYEIVRKFFEETPPDIVPAEFEYETVAQFPLVH
jgi:hypothetical protein